MIEEGIFKNGPFSGRENFGQFLNELGLTEVIAEIGVHQAEFAEQILTTWSGKVYFAIDPWDDSVCDYTEETLSLYHIDGKGDRTQDMLIAFNRLKKFGTRACFCKMRNEEAALVFGDVLDFVYLDGNHERVPFASDLKRWWPKIKSGGILAGHDICMPQVPDFPWGANIKPALEEFFAPRSLNVFLVPQDGLCAWSWFVRKP